MAPEGSNLVVAIYSPLGSLGPPPPPPLAGSASAIVASDEHIAAKKEAVNDLEAAAVARLHMGASGAAADRSSGVGRQPEWSWEGLLLELTIMAISIGVLIRSALRSWTRHAQSKVPSDEDATVILPRNQASQQQGKFVALRNEDNYASPTA